MVVQSQHRRHQVLERERLIVETDLKTDDLQGNIEEGTHHRHLRAPHHRRHKRSHILLIQREKKSVSNEIENKKK